MSDNQDSEFVRSRISADPHETYVEEYRIPQWKVMVEHLWEPLLVLNRSQAVMLAEVDIMTDKEAGRVLETLDDLEDRVPEGIDRETMKQHEDPYLYLESTLVETLGEDIGGKIHTGRSRNDLLGAAVRIAMREQLLRVLDELLALHETLLQRASETTTVVFPAFTHSQPAQPIVFAHYLLAFSHLLSRDFERLVRSYENANLSPLGSAAIGGTQFPLDRDRLAKLAGFSDIHYNSYDAISSVDFIPEATNNLAVLMTNISRISRDYIEWSMFEFQFLEIDDSLATVSTIMPQKKNPSVLEKTRAAAGDTIGAANSAIVHLKGVRFGDAGERSRYAFVPFLEEIDNVVRTIRLFEASVDTTEVNEDRMLADAEKSFCTMTSLADTLVRTENISFRQGHEISASVTRQVSEDGRTADEITFEDVNSATMERLGRPLDGDADDILASIRPSENVTRHDIVGGTAPSRCREDLENQREVLATQMNEIETYREEIDDSRTEREQRCAELKTNLQ